MNTSWEKLASCSATCHQAERGTLWLGWPLLWDARGLRLEPAQESNGPNAQCKQPKAKNYHQEYDPTRDRFHPMLLFLHLGMVRTPCSRHGCRVWFWGAYGHHAVLEVVSNQPPIDRVCDDESGQERYGHDKPEGWMAWAMASHDGGHPEPHHRDHAGHECVHRDEFRDEGLAQRVRIVTASRPLHEQGLKNRPAEAEAQKILHCEVNCPCEAEEATDDRTHQDASPIAGYAVHGRAKRLPPARRRVALMQPRTYKNAPMGPV